MANSCRLWKRRNLCVGDSRGIHEFIGKSSQPRTKHEADGRTQACLRQEKLRSSFGERESVSHTLYRLSSERASALGICFSMARNAKLRTSSQTLRTVLPAAIAPWRARYPQQTSCTPQNFCRHKRSWVESSSDRTTSCHRAESCAPDSFSPYPSSRCKKGSRRFQLRASIRVSCPSVKRPDHLSPKPPERRTSCRSAMDEGRPKRQGSDHSMSGRSRPAHFGPPFPARAATGRARSLHRPHGQSVPRARVQSNRGCER